MLATISPTSCESPSSAASRGQTVDQGTVGKLQRAAQGVTYQLVRKSPLHLLLLLTEVLQQAVDARDLRLVAQRAEVVDRFAIRVLSRQRPVES